MNELITIQDALIVPFWLIVAYVMATRIKSKHLEEKPHYKYFKMALFTKIFVGVVFALIYLLYYGGGDTTYYFLGSKSLVGMIGKDLPTFFKIMGGNLGDEVYSMFDRTTGYPTYWRDPNSYAVCRFNVPFYLLGFGSYLGNTLVMNIVLFFGIWRFYEMLLQIFPNNEKGLALSLFFVPSIVFWSSGVLKDGWTLVSIFYIFSSLYQLVFKRKDIYKNLLILLFWSYISISIRPYIFYVTLVSGIVWLLFSLIATIKSRFLRTVALPFLIILGWGFGSVVFMQTSSSVSDRYSSIDAILETAWIIQDDLKRDYYGGNSFDIGYFEPTIPGVIKKAPQAIVAGLLRPFLWEGDGVLMLLSGLENFLLLLFFAFVIIKSRIYKFINRLLSEPFLIGMFVLAITFGFFVGLTTANFGALVRYAIPAKLAFIIVLIQLYFKLKPIAEESVNDEAKLDREDKDKLERKNSSGHTVFW